MMPLQRMSITTEFSRIIKCESTKKGLSAICILCITKTLASMPSNELKMRDLGGEGENVRAAESGDSANEIKTALNITTSTTQCSEEEQSIASWVRDKAPLITP